MNDQKLNLGENEITNMSDVKATKPIVGKQDSTESKKTTRKKRKRKPKDPNAPKRNVSAYVHFCKYARELYSKKFPDKKPTEITTMVGVAWKKVDKEDQPKDEYFGKFFKLAADDKSRYVREKEEYLKTHPKVKSTSEDAEDE